MLSVLTPYVTSLRLDAQAVVNCLYGLQSKNEYVQYYFTSLHFVLYCVGMYSNRAEVRLFLSAMVPRVKRTTDRRMCALEVANALWGLQGMDSDHNEVRTLLHALTETHLKPCTEVSA